MSVFHLTFEPTQEYKTSYFGGYPHLADVSSWPTCPSNNQPLLHLLTLNNDFFFMPMLKSTDSLSVFVAFDYDNTDSVVALTRKMAVNDQEQFENINTGYCRVLLHQTGTSPCSAPTEGYRALPLCRIDRQPFTEQEIADETNGSGRGLDVSKFAGIPGWLQDDIKIHPRYSYILQISEYSIRQLSHQHEGVFRDGIGYLFLNNNLRKLTSQNEGGIFFIQFT